VEDAAGIATVHVRTWQSAYRGIVPDAHLDSLSIEQRTQIWQERLSQPHANSFTFVAEDQQTGQIVGFATGGRIAEERAPYTGELYAIYVLPEYHGRGLGRKLVRTVAESLLSIGLDSMIVWVLADNSARNFYRALGGEYILTQQFELGGALLDEEGYGWPDIRVLL
jgi:ribosomal protein S18 acetylase RimI-like enzyme